jgi:colicin import membrane protein
VISSPHILPYNEWKIPLNLAIAVHVLVFASAVFLPGIFKAKPKFADIYTVSIITIPEPAMQAPPAPPAPPAAVQPAAPPPAAPAPKAKKVAPIAEKAPAPTPVKSEKPAVSLKPLKKKKINTNVAKQEVDRKKELQQAAKEAEILQEKARLAQEALEAERRLLAEQQVQPVITPRPSSGSNSASTGRSMASGSNLIENQYYAAIKGRMLQFWALPDYMQKNNNLRAVVVITFSADGSLLDMFFEQKSGDRVYDQFVRKAIEMANPFPPIPPALKKQRYEIGMVFTPGGIE